MSASAKSVPDKRQALLTAALELFLERGFHGTSVPDIAQRAASSAASIYRYFESKEALVNVLYQQYAEQLTVALLSGIEAGAPPRQTFGGVWRRACRFAHEEPAALAFLTMHRGAPYLDGHSVELERRLFESALAYGRLVTEPSPENREPGAAALVVALAVGAFQGLVSSARADVLTLDEAIVAASEEATWAAIASAALASTN